MWDDGMPEGIKDRLLGLDQVCDSEQYVGIYTALTVWAYGSGKMYLFTDIYNLTRV